MKKLGVLLVIIILAIFAFNLKGQVKKNTNTNFPQESKNEAIPTALIRKVTITKSGFNPATITINRGETVKWINDSGQEASVNSDPYPNNNLHPFLNLGEIPNGYSSDALFEDTGTYKYHNQKTPAQIGTVVVK